MDLVHVSESVVTEEDRISNLPNEVIHRILSFLDMKYAVQTCILSRKWKRIWTLMPELNLSSLNFVGLSQFGKFVKHVLSHRNDFTRLSAVKLTFAGNPTSFVAKNVIKYAYSHNVTQLTMIWFCEKVREFPQCFYTSHTLKHLTLKYEPKGLPNASRHIPNSVWDFPALETLHLSNLRFGVSTDECLNLFPKCVNLKDLTLHNCAMSVVRIFNLCAPQLSGLTITGVTYFPTVFNVVAPKLKTMTALVMWSGDYLRLFTEGLETLEKVNLSSSCSVREHNKFFPWLLDLFQKLRTAKFVILDAWIIEALSLSMDQVSYQPCPFNNLKCLKIDIAPLSSLMGHRDRIAEMIPQVRNYLLQNSPDATLIVDLPQVPPMRVKRPMQTVQNDTMANKMAKLDVPTAPILSSPNVPHQISRHEVHNDGTTMNMANLVAVEKQPETLPEDKRMLETKIQMQDEVIAKQKEMFEVKIRIQDEVIAKQKAMFEAKIRMQDEVIAKQKTVFVAQIQMQDEVIAKQKAIFEARIDIQDDVIVKQKEKIQIQNEVIGKQKAMFETKVQMQDEVIAKQKAIFEAKTQMVEAAKLQHEKLMAFIIKCKIAELKVKIESGNQDHEVIASMDIYLKSVMDLIPENLRVNLEARFSSMYEGFKSVFLTHVDDSQWAKIESELEKEYQGFSD